MMRNWKIKAFVLAMIIGIFPLFGNDVFSMPKTDGEPFVSRSKAEANRDASLRKQAKMRFESLDSDQDGKVTRQEYLAPAEKRFNQADTNGDGLLTEEEFGGAWVEQMRNIREESGKKK